METNKKEMINSPEHYLPGTYEVIKVIEAWGLDNNFCRGNLIKYAARAGKKDPAKTIEDLEKAKWYLQREIDNLKKKQEEHRLLIKEKLTSQNTQTITTKPKELDKTITIKPTEIDAYVWNKPSWVYGNNLVNFWSTK